MPFDCPQCHSRNLRYSRIRTSAERFWSWFGIRPLRCRDCELRFIERTWRLRTVRYARCPRCWRLDLSRWNTHDYYTSPITRLLLLLGARPYRCEYCRTNFVSFRHRKERYRSRHQRGAQNPTPAAAQSTGEEV